jgi:hypothetical protein
MLDAGQTQAARELGIRVWDQVCRHCDGIAIGSTMAALAEHGGLTAIAARERQAFDELQPELRARPGYLRVALRLLADQGWVRLTGSPGADALTVAPTPSGMTVMTQLGAAYGRAAWLLAAADRMGDILSGTAGEAGEHTLRQAVDLMKARWDLPAEAGACAQAQVAAHLDGHVIAPAMTVLTRRGILRPDVTEYHLVGICARGRRRALALAFEALRLQGWAVGDDVTIRLTPAGIIAAACAPQYWHPVCYVPLLRRVPELIFGVPGAASGQPTTPGTASLPEAAEEHPGRELDIRFSGQVFTRTCRTPFLEIVLPYFDQPIERQPSAVVDIGCGDGTLLTTLYDAIRARTRRGRLLGSHPLRLVGVEPSMVARSVAEQRLRSAGLPGIVIEGDVSDPGGLAEKLASAGLDGHDALYVCKSVIHDRPYIDPGAADADLHGEPPPGLLSAFADPSGASISGTKIVSSLVALFLSWRGLASRHGLVVIEAHSVDPVTAAFQLGRTMATSLDATHGYSHQYLVTPDAFSWAARAGGFMSSAHREPGAHLAGYTVLTIDHFVVARG